MRRASAPARAGICACAVLGFVFSLGASAHADEVASPTPVSASPTPVSFRPTAPRPVAQPSSTPSPPTATASVAAPLRDHVLVGKSTPSPDAVGQTPSAAVATNAPATQLPATISKSAGLTFDTLPSLAISVPPSVSLGTSLAGSTAALSGSLGAVTITSTAGTAGTTFGWTSTVTATAFTTGGASSAESVAASRATYTSGSFTARTGNFSGSSCIAGQLTTLSAVTLGSSRTAFSCSSVSATGATSLTWNPTISVTPNTTNVPGAYTSTITHSVA